jgi:hypothetical protein
MPTGFLNDGAINELSRAAGVSTADARARRELMAEKQILGLKPAPRLE